LRNRRIALAARHAHVDVMKGLPPLILFVIKWTAIGIAGGLLALLVVLFFDVGGLGSLVQRSSTPWLAVYVLAMSFAGTGGPVALTFAVLLCKDFGGKGPGNSRLERWKAGLSAEVDEDRPLDFSAGATRDRHGGA
jgi:hypothetical protein